MGQMVLGIGSFASGHLAAGHTLKSHFQNDMQNTCLQAFKLLGNVFSGGSSLLVQSEGW